MSLNFYSFHAGDDDNGIEDQPTQPIPVQKPPHDYREDWPGEFPDLAAVDKMIRDARASYRRRNCVICQMVHEIESGVYGPGIAEEDLCDEHWARLHRMAAENHASLDTIRRVCQYAKDRNIWPPDHHPPVL